MDTRDKIILEQQKTIESLTAEISMLRQEITNLTETLRTIAGKRFSPKKESLKEEPIEMDDKTVNEAEYILDNASGDEISEEVPKTKKSRKPRGKRDDLFKNVPIEKELLTIPEEEKKCDFCNNELKLLGEEFIREELRIIPAKVIRVQIYQEVYYCPSCKDGDEFIAKKPMALPAMFKHSLASPSIVAKVMYDKYVNAVPLNRQEKDFERQGVTLTRSVQANWINNAAIEYFEPVYNELHKKLLKREVIMSDETPCQVHREEGKKATSRSYMWVHRSGEDGLEPIILYDYQPSRSGDHAVNFLDEFSGYHQCDGFSGYNKLTKVTRIACLAHIRRKFFDAVPKQKTIAAYIPAVEGVRFCDKLFELEREFSGLTFEERKLKRLEQSKPVLDAFWSWLDEQNPPSGSNLYKAVNYALNQKEYMNNFLLDGRISISNNLTENSVRPYTLIRKNSLFHDTPRGATASAIICSLIETAKAQKLDVLKYLEFVLTQMLGYANDSDSLDELMPWSETAKKLCMFFVVLGMVTNLIGYVLPL